MLMPSVEAKLLQALNIKLNEDILIIGSGSGYLSSCASLLGNKVHAIDIYSDLIEISKRNLNHDFLRSNILYEHLDIMSNLSIIKKYKVIILTSSINDIDIIANHMGSQSRAFMFLGKNTAPIKTGVLITKLKSSSLIREDIIETDVKPIIMKNND